jgi:hypothetical protein
MWLLEMDRNLVAMLSVVFHAAAAAACSCVWFAQRARVCVLLSCALTLIRHRRMRRERRRQRMHLSSNKNKFQSNQLMKTASLLLCCVDQSHRRFAAAPTRAFSY